MTKQGELIEDIYEQAESKQDQFDFSADKKIDINNLHTEIQDHSEQCFKYNKRRSKLQHVVNQLEELKKQTRSQLINECIANPSLCDPAGGKYTDKKAETYYRLNSGYKEVISALLDAKHEHDCMAGMQRIIEDKKWEHKDLVALSMSQYFESTESKETRAVDGVEGQYAEIDKHITADGKKNNSNIPKKEIEIKESDSKPAGPENEKITPRRRRKSN